MRPAAAQNQSGDRRGRRGPCGIGKLRLVRLGWSLEVRLLGVVASLAAGCAANPVLVDSDRATGFAIYRSGRLSAHDLQGLCRLGVEEILVLDGSGRQRECRLRERVCPDLRVVHDVEQSAGEPLSAAFLRRFDAWVERARAEGRRIAFRCHRGWHRAGRLAAYYRIRHQGLTAREAKAEMHQLGRFMWRHPYLDAQVDALADYAAGRPCSGPEEHCVTRGGPKTPSLVGRDTCSTERGTGGSIG